MIENVLLNYEIGSLLEVKNIENGTTSNSKYIKTSTGEYVLRELKDELQGSLEWLISEKIGAIIFVLKSLKVKVAVI